MPRAISCPTVKTLYDSIRDRIHVVNIIQMNHKLQFNHNEYLCLSCHMLARREYVCESVIDENEDINLLFPNMSTIRTPYTKSQQIFLTQPVLGRANPGMLKINPFHLSFL